MSTPELAAEVRRLRARVAELTLADEAIRESEARFRMLSALSTDWYWQTDTEHRLVALDGNDGNSATLSRRSSVGKRRWELPVVNITAEQWAEHRRMLDAHEPFRDFEYQRIGDDGELHWVCISGRPFFDDRGRFLGYRGVGRNIDAAKQAEAALRKSKEAAEAASLAKSRFMANMSHEIRTPMNGIVGMAELALSMIHDPQLADCVATIKESADSLRRIIDSILDFSKVEAGKLELEHTPFALRALVDSTLKSFTAVARQRELALGWAVPPEVPDALVGDPTRLREILVNLVGNALKFTAVGSVQVQVASQATSSAQTESSCSLAFVVRDTGIGIAADKLEAIFEPFSQADSSTTRKYGGTGLGLTICARLAKLMGGDIGVHSTPGVGSTFRLRLPFERAAAVAAEPRSAAAVAAVTGVSTVAAAAAPPPAAAVPARSLDILLAEDNPVNQIVAEQMLLRAGHRVSIAGNGVEALALLRVREFDLVLMDMQMPEMGGVEAARHLRAIEAGDGRPRTPVIAITANAMDSDRAECLAAGMDDFIAKPVQWAEACRAIERAISASHAAKAPA